MGTHPIFESDFDCLTEMDGEENNEDVTLSGTPGHSTISDTITVEELDRRQYENDLELVRIELESKKLQLESQKHDFAEQIELLEERAEEAERNMKLYQLKFTELQNQKGQSGKSAFREELKEIVQRQKILEATNRKLQAEASLLEEGLTDLSVNEAEYGQLTLLPRDQRSIKQTAKIKLFETIQPMKSENQSLLRQIDALSTEYAQESQKSQVLQSRLSKNESERKQLLEKLEVANKELETARSLVATNYEKAKKFDDLNCELETIKTANLDLTSKKKMLTEKLEETTAIHKELCLKFESTKQRESLLEEDKSYLKKQFEETNGRKSELEKINNDLLDRNLRLQAAREELIEKYLIDADQVRKRANDEQTNQIASLKTETEIELERIKKHLHDLFSREADALKSARDHAERERDNLRFENNQLKATISQIQQDLSVLTSQRESESSESNKRVANAELEAKRYLLSKNELERVLDRTEREASASKRKCEILQREIFNVTSSANQEKVHLEAENNDLQRRLAAYEKIESDLDALVLQAADGESDDPLWSFQNVPIQSRRRIEQSARLAKRVINLEKINIDLNREVEQLKNHNNKIKESLSNGDKALDSVDQPYAYLVQNQRSKDGEIARLNDTIKSQNKRIIQLEETV